MQGHLPVDGAGHNVPGGEVPPIRGVLLHEPAAVGSKKLSPFTSHCLRNQKVFALGDGERGGVELYVLGVDHPGAGAVGHGQAVPPRPRGICGVAVDPP